MKAQRFRRLRTDRDAMSEQLKLAHGALCALPISSEQALHVLGRVIAGLIVAKPDSWDRPEELIISAWQRSHDILPSLPTDVSLPAAVSSGTVLRRVAKAIAPLNLSSIDCDLLGPLYAAGVSKEERLRTGIFFTPPELVDLVLDQSGVLESTSGHVVDPAAGTGAFLVRALSRVRVARGCSAAASLFHRLAAIEASPCAWALLQLNLAMQWAIICQGNPVPMPSLPVAQGDALTAYSEFPPVRGVGEDVFDNPELAAIAREAGYAYVIGNPPYVGESGNRELFAKYRAHPFWSQYSESKMDFLQYFVVLGLSKIQLYEGGRLCFLTSAYWLTADGAQGLRDLILSLAIVREVTFVSGRGHFHDAPGHDSLVIVLERCHDAAVRNTSQVRIREDVEDRVSVYDAPQGAWRGHPWFLSGSTGELTVLSELARYPTLRTAFVARQGVVPGAQRVGDAELRELGPEWVERHGIQHGEGIFVLSSDEVARLQLPASEQRFLRPFVKNSHLRRYGVDMVDSLWLVYLRHDEVREEDCPHLVAHLARFRPLLVRKREYRLGRRDWFHIHWPRDESIFTGEKIMTAHRAAAPGFVWCPYPLFAATDVYFIVPGDHRGQDVVIGLKALTGILNSVVGRFWFAHRTKAKGGQREFFSRALERFPLPCPTASDQQVLAELEKYVDELQALHEEKSTVGDSQERIVHLEEAVDRQVLSLYRLGSECEKELIGKKSPQARGCRGGGWELD